MNLINWVFMKLKGLIISLLFCFSFLFSACSEKDGVKPDKEIYQVEFQYDGKVLAKRDVLSGELVCPIETPVAEDVFAGWFVKVEGYWTKYNFSTPVRSNLTIVALCKTTDYHTVTYRTGMEGVEDIVIAVPDGGMAEMLFLSTEEDEVIAWYSDAQKKQIYVPAPLKNDLELFAMWRSMDPSLPPLDPNRATAECEMAELTDGAVIEYYEGASGGRAVNMPEKESGSLTLTLNIPKSGFYSLVINYMTVSEGKSDVAKVNQVEIPGVLAPKMVNFTGNDKFSSKFVGVYEFRKGRVKLKVSSIWGGTIFDNVILSNVGTPTIFKGEFEDGELGGSSYLENVLGKASNGNAVTLGANGTIDLKLKAPKTAWYKVLLGYFGWAGQTKQNYFEIPGHINLTLQTLVGTNEVIDLEVGTIELRKDEEFHVVITPSWGWTYYDYITFIEVPKPEEVEEGK